ncbi:MAG: Epoxyqueuosine reductase [uncultured Sphingomonadaceae bacterium]|uniref:Epoxyqueuosine reductase n=1 Tax=uncultured Sphingomonadaceae bacterium TaxID=169976 RepID=A0A6J4TFL0_9SPHN|nr:MAG: Epoxyqueuosine reductase [uncultured Sphingomonadaceae bacterium]
MVTDKQALREQIADRARALGFAACGFVAADAAPRTGERLREWLAEGRHGDMLWMEEKADRRESPRALWPEVRTVIALGMSYAPAADPLRLAGEGGVGRVSVYAQGADYHDVLKKGLRQLARWIAESTAHDVKLFVDTAPVMEKPLAHAAGLGWQGKHTNLISRAHGNWLFLGAIYTTLDLADAPHAHAVAPGHRDLCGSCDRCQRACPTDAFPAPYRLDARRCISYLTIEHRGPIPHEFREAIGNRVYGCDDCLAVCPWNRFASAAQANRAFLPRAELAAPALADLLDLDDAGFRRVFAGSPIKRIGRGRMVRNAAVAAGNSGDPALLPALERLAGDPDPVVAEAAAWASARLRGSGGEAGSAVEVLAAGPARVDVGNDGLGALARGIEVEVDHAQR